MTSVNGKALKTIRAKLDDEIEKIKEAEREEIYSRLSEEDRYALERGRKIIQEEKERGKQMEQKKCPQKNPQRSIQERGMAANLGRYILLWQQCS